MSRITLILMLCCTFAVAGAQDIFCTVQIVPAAKVVSVPNSAQILKNLEVAITEFMNNRKWTADKFQPNERIELKFILTVGTLTPDGDIRATAQIQSTRPVYGSSYSTLLMNQVDEDWAFKFTEFQAMEFVEGQNTTNLTSLLAFYAFMAAGMDYDSFSKFGGTPYFNKAQTVVNTAQTLSEPGWKAFSSKNNRSRYDFIENVLSERFKMLREVYYLYHRQGFDVMSADLAKGRAQITKCLEMVQKVFKQNQNAMFLKVFFDAKSDELVGVYSKIPASEKNKIVELLNQIDIAHYKKYQAILNN